MADDPGTRICQLAIRGALELPNDPFRALAEIEIKDQNPNKLRAAERRKLRESDVAYSAHLLAMYQDEET